MDVDDQMIDDSMRFYFTAIHCGNRMAKFPMKILQIITFAKEKDWREKKMKETSSELSKNKSKE